MGLIRAGDELLKRLSAPLSASRRHRGLSWGEPKDDKREESGSHREKQRQHFGRKNRHFRRCRRSQSILAHGRPGVWPVPTVVKLSYRF